MWTTQAFGQGLGNGSVTSIFQSKLAASLAHADSVPISQAISQIADGAGWKTTIVLVNTGTAPANYTLQFWQSSGAAMTLSIGGQGMQQVSGQIPVNGIATIASDGSSSTLTSGWGQLTAPSSIGGTAIFRQSPPGRQASEAAVPILSPVSSTLLLPYDNTNGLVTSLALVNPDPVNGAAVNANIYDQNGNLLANGVINLSPQGQQPFALPSQFPAAANQIGLAVFSNPSGGMLTGLGLRFSGAPFTSLQMLTPAQ